MTENKFDLTGFLTDQNVEWTITHENVTRRCVGICCPYCDDEEFHLGIFRDYSHNFTCWRCGAKGPFQKLAKDLCGITAKQLEMLMESSDDFSDLPAVDRIKQMFAKDPDVTPKVEPAEFILEMPESRPISYAYLPKRVRRFLAKRKFTVDDCIDHHARYCNHGASRWYNHLILPVFADNEVVSLVGRRLNDGKPKYLNSKGINLKNYLYGQDEWYPGASQRTVYGQRMWLVEGPLDAWRIGIGALASFGAKLSAVQRQIIYRLQPRELIVAWDYDAYKSALEIGRFFSSLLPCVRVLRFPEGHDPDSLGIEEKLLDLVNETAAL